MSQGQRYIIHLKNIISEQPIVIRCFGSLIFRHLYLGDLPGCSALGLCPSSTLHHGSPLLIRNHREAFSAALLISLVAFFFCSHLIPRNLNRQRSGCPGNFMLPTSTNPQRRFQWNYNSIQLKADSVVHLHFPQD